MDGFVEEVLIFKHRRDHYIKIVHGVGANISVSTCIATEPGSIERRVEHVDGDYLLLFEGVGRGIVEVQEFCGEKAFGFVSLTVWPAFCPYPDGQSHDVGSPFDVVVLQ